MKFYLVKRQTLDMSFGHVLRGQNGHTVRRIVLPALIAPVGNSKEEKVFCEKVNLKLSQIDNTEKFNVNQNNESLLTQKSKELIVSIASLGDTSLKGFVGVADGYGDILKKLHQVFEDETLRVEVVITNFRDRELATVPNSVYVLTKELYLTYRHNLKVYASQDAEFQFGSQQFVQRFQVADALLTGSITIVCSVDDAALSCDNCQEKFAVYRKMLHEEIWSDAVIMAGDGIPVKCHKAMLSTQSPVFRVAFKTDMEEGKTGQLVIPEMTDEKSVRAFLGFLYNWDISPAQENSLVAFELFHAGHKYDIQQLELAMEHVLLSKPYGWFDAEVALKLYLFARNLPKYSGEYTQAHSNSRTDLKLKAVEILRL